MLKIQDYAFSFGLFFSRQIMLKIMLAYYINAYQAKIKIFEASFVDLLFFFHSAKTSVYCDS